MEIDRELFGQIFPDRSEALDLLETDMRKFGVSKNAIAASSHISRKRIATIFRGRNPSNRELMRMMKVIAFKRNMTKGA